MTTYTVTLKCVDYTLPKKTISIANMIDAAKTATTTVESYRKQYEFLKTVLGEENAEQVLDGKTLDTIDLTELSIAFLRTEKAYIKPVEDVAKELDKDEADSNVMLSKIIELGDSMEKVTKSLDKINK